MTCSCEVTFPTGAPPMGFGTQIKKQSKLASVNCFKKMTEAIRTCVEEEDGTSVYSEGDATDSLVYDLNETSRNPSLRSLRSSMSDGVMPSVVYASSGNKQNSSKDNDDDDDDDVSRLTKLPKKDTLKRIRRWGSVKAVKSLSKSRRKLEKKVRTRNRFNSDSQFSHY